MSNIIFYSILIVSFFLFGVPSLVWPNKMRRYNFGFYEVSDAPDLDNQIPRCSFILFSFISVIGLLRS
jgi:hypothetical protein